MSCIRRAMIPVAAMFLLATLSSVAEAQILRPQGEGGDDILTMQRVIRLELALPVDPATAYDAWTVAMNLVEWLPHWAEMRVDVGEPYSMGWDGYEGVWTGRYLEVERPGRLVFTWIPPEGVFPSGSYETVVTLTFEEVEEGRTMMVLEHSGFAEASELEAQLQAWRGYMFALRAYLLRAAAQ